MSFLFIGYTVLSWTICLLVISRVWSVSMFFFAFETVAWKLLLSLRSLILKMWSLEFWCISRVDLWRLLQPVVVKAFLLPVDLQISQPCKLFQPSRQKMPLLLNGLTGLWLRIRHVFFFFQPTFCPRKEESEKKKKRKKRRERFFEDLRSSKLHVISL